MFILLIFGLLAAQPKATAEVTPDADSCKQLGAEVVTLLHEQGHDEVAFICLPAPKLGKEA